MEEEHNSGKNIIDEKIIQKLREREWKRSLIIGKNKYKCKYYLLLELLFYAIFLVIFFETFSMYLKYRYPGIDIEKILFSEGKAPTLRFLPFAMGVFELLCFFLSKFGYFWYLIEAKKYKCLFFYFSIGDMLSERWLWGESNFLFVSGISLIVLQFIIDSFFSLYQWVFPTIIFVGYVILSSYILPLFTDSESEIIEFPQLKEFDEYIDNYDIDKFKDK